MPAYRTNDKGATWQKCDGIANGIRVVADKVNPNRFYAVNIPDGVYYESTDGGAHFSADTILTPLPRQQTPRGPMPVANRGDNRGGQDRIYAVPGREGDRWIAAYDGLYRLQPGQPLQQLDKVRTIYAFGFGMAKPGNDYPAMYLVGIVNGIHGIFRSDDVAKTWTRINDDQHNWGLLLQITGDPKKYGRVYVGSHGRGASYGDPK
jgi:hypothetical protein